VLINRLVISRTVWDVVLCVQKLDLGQYLGYGLTHFKVTRRLIFLSIFSSFPSDKLLSQWPEVMYVTNSV
jgi:hypothetical protein